MRILLTGATGGIGSAIGESLKEHEVISFPKEAPREEEQFDWLVCAHGILKESNLLGTFHTNTFLNMLLTENSKFQKGVIHISSTAAINGNSMFPYYAASKAALNSFVTSLAKLHPDKQFYAICPGPTDTPMWRNLGLQGTPQSPSEVAKVVKDCMEGKFKSGDIITVRNGVVSV